MNIGIFGKFSELKMMRARPTVKDEPGSITKAAEPEQEGRA